MPAHDVESWDSRFHWGTLRALGNSRLVTSSIVWLFVVPIAAKLLAPFAGQHTLDLSWLNEPLAVSVALPFSWQRFYLMSWLFLIGQVIYWLACPEIVRKYPSFGAYRADHASDGELREFIRVAIQQRSDQHTRILAGLTEGWDEMSRVQGQKAPKIWELVRDRFNIRLTARSQDASVPQNQVLSVLLEAEQHVHRGWFWVSGAFSVCGLLLFLWVVIEGVVEVVKLL